MHVHPLSCKQQLLALSFLWCCMICTLLALLCTGLAAAVLMLLRLSRCPARTWPTVSSQGTSRVSSCSVSTFFTRTSRVLLLSKPTCRTPRCDSNSGRTAHLKAACMLLL
jgi:hypothetical protein